MKNNLPIFYDIFIDELIVQNNFWIIKNEKDTYYFVPYLRTDKDINYLNEITRELIRMGIPTHTFIPNRKKGLISTIDNNDYVLLRINCPEEKEFNLSAINALYKNSSLNTRINLRRNNWAKLWSEKIDYFEYQMSELGSDKQIILNSISYYVGLAENAISYVNQVEKHHKDDVKITLARKRIYSPNYAINYLNPLNYIIDLEVRDIAEYIKASIFNDNDIWEEIDNLFKERTFTSFELHMLYARLLYPSYYFDIYEQIMNSNVNEEELIPIITKCDMYEDFLQEIYYYLNNFVPLISIDWLIKKNPTTQL